MLGESSQSRFTYFGLLILVAITAVADDPRCCSIVVMSGDGGITDAVKYARRAGKCVFVVAWEGTLHPALADAANDYAFVDDLRPLISRVAI